MIQAPVMRDVLLVGGGHSHALLIRQWAMRPLPGVRLTLVSDGVLTPYSGMLPGLVAGHYTAADVHIDLMRLCLAARVRFINTRMTAIDVRARQVALADRPPLEFDLLSLDTGSTPDLSVPGAAEFSTPVKPVHAFHARWLQIRQRLESAGGSETLDVGVVGSGAGGFEIVMAMRHALTSRQARLHWFLRGREPLGGRPPRVRMAALEAARAADVVVHQDFDVDCVSAGPCLQARDGRQQVLNELLWCTGAVGPSWLADTGLQTDARGFLLTDQYLRSVSCPDIFATGDIGTQIDTPSPKAGVYAVRQAPVLYENLRRSLLAKPLKAYRPQHDFLSLMALGPKRAIASRGPLMVTGTWVWHWKDRIDQRFMTRVRELPPMSASTISHRVPDALRDQATIGSGPPCNGCGAKVGSGILHSSLARLAGTEPAPGILSGLEQRGDAATFDPQGVLVVQSVDQLNALIDDPWLFARVAARHALADVLSEGARPHSAQLVLTLPRAAPAIQQRELNLVLSGVMSALQEDEVTLMGGHTAEGPELQIGLVINGLIEPARRPDAQTCTEGDYLLLTRGIGSGVLFAAAMRGRAHGESLTGALTTMSASQRQASEALFAHQPRVVTDVTGFGLAGHLQQLLSTTGCTARIDLSAVPVLDGAWPLAGDGIRSSLYPANAQVLEHMDGTGSLSMAWRHLLADPQTAGGLLAVIPHQRAEDALAAVRLHAPQAALVGRLYAPSVLARHTFVDHLPDDRRATSG